MLRQLSIQNYATVDTLEIEFKSGMSVITGETGAGKSVILGALGLALGDRADKTVVRAGADKADISAEFDTSAINDAGQWLAENDLDGDGDGVCLLRRIVGGDGRSRGYINGSPVTMAALKSLGGMLLDIHDQHEHQSLLHKATHQRLLDDYCVDAGLGEQLRSTWKQWQQNFRQRQELSARSQENSAQTQLLAYQLNELEELNIDADEVESLESEFKSLNHADETIAAVQAALNLCGEDGEPNAASLLHQALAALLKLPERHPRIDDAVALLNDAEIQLGEAVSDLRVFNDEFDADPQRLDQVNARLSELHGVARKHKVKPEELTALAASLREQLNRFQNSDEELERLAANDALLREQYRKLAQEVSVQRRQGATRLARQVNRQLHKLGMPHATLEVQLTATESDQPAPNGLEVTEFLVSTNPGQAAKPLIRIASGGELSRISLAIQVITAQTSQTPSLVFDEVDVGIGGGIARVVGRLLRELGDRTQILCVTHQAQVAGMGHHHFLVSKQSKKNSTLTRIHQLSGDAVVKEIARMLGGEEFSAESLAHAEQMVAAN